MLPPTLLLSLALGLGCDTIQLNSTEYYGSAVLKYPSTTASHFGLCCNFCTKCHPPRYPGAACAAWTWDSATQICRLYAHGAKSRASVTCVSGGINMPTPAPTPWPTMPPTPPFAGCVDDWDCALAGDCVDGKCKCDAWAKGPQCTTLNLLPVDTDVASSDGVTMGYHHPTFSSWGGRSELWSKAEGGDGKWHGFVSEILCNTSVDANKGVRCGLQPWQTSSQSTHVVADAPVGPYSRVGVALPREAHDTTIKRGPNGEWLLYHVIGNSPAHVAWASSPHGPWSPVMDANNPNAPRDVGGSSTNDPSPTLLANGSMLMVYRSSDSRAEPCSHEAVFARRCDGGWNASEANCSPPLLTYLHTAEDPGVWRTRRGWHMLVNGMPGWGCMPKTAQGGLAWSRNGINWSALTLGAYNSTVAFKTNGVVTKKDMNRRERPKVTTAADGTPLVFWSAICEDGGCRKTTESGSGSLGIWTLAQKFATS